MVLRQIQEGRYSKVTPNGSTHSATKPPTQWGCRCCRRALLRISLINQILLCTGHKCADSGRDCWPWGL